MFLLEIASFYYPTNDAKKQEKSLAFKNTFTFSRVISSLRRRMKYDGEGKRKKLFTLSCQKWRNKITGGEKWKVKRKKKRNVYI